MPPLSELPGSTPRKKLIHALIRLGFVFDKSGGKGSHVLVRWPTTNKSVTLPFENLPKQVLYYVLKEIEINTAGKITWEHVKKEL